MTITKSIAEPTFRAPSRKPPVARVASYEVFAPIAQGGGGSVWLAWDRRSPDLDRVVAVKFLHRSETGEVDLDQKRRFLREAKIGSAIRHTNVVEVLEVGEQDGEAYLVMPYIDGVDVRVLQREGALPIDVALSIAVDALRGLDAAHEARGVDGAPLGVVHRDMSPHNLLVAVDGVTKLTDFGIARPLEGPERSTSGWGQGKVAYFSPEQSRGEPLDRRSDLFSLGTVLWELVVGRTLFRDSDPFLTAHRVQTMRVPAPSSENAALPAAFDAVVLKALARDVDARYATAAAMLADVTRIAAEERVVLGPEKVSTYVRTHAAGALAERADVVRQGAHARVTSASEPTDAPPRIASSPMPSSSMSRKRVALVASMVLALVVVGLVGLSGTRADSSSAASSASASASAAVVASVVASAPLSPPSSSSVAPAASASAMAPSSSASSRGSKPRAPSGPRGPKLPMSVNPF